MIDKTDPEIQKYVQEELQKQKEQIAERMIWRNINVPYFGSAYYENVVYYVSDLSRETIDKIAEQERRRNRNYQDGYKEGALLVDVRYVWHTLKKQEQNASLEHITEGRVDQSGLKAWRKNPDKYAVLELCCLRVWKQKIL